MTMLVMHKFEACRRCPQTTVWRVTNGRLVCDRCKRKKDFPRRLPLRVNLRFWSRWLSAARIDRLFPGSWARR
jgi:hypothetical protein